LKEKLERLATDSGLETQEAFIEQMAALYELQQLKEGHGSGYAKQIDELEYHTRRSVELFIGMINTEAAERLELSQRHDETLADRAATIFTVEQENSELRKEAKAQADELARLVKENEAQVKQAEQLMEISRKDNLLVEEYRQRIDTLSGLVNEYKAAAAENHDLKSKVSELTSLSEKQAGRTASLEEDVATQETLRAEQLRQQEQRHREALERIAERKDVEKERELLAIRTEYQGKLEKANEEATAKLRELYAQIDRLRETHEQQLRQLQQPKAADDEKNPPQRK
jgi:hypothetical protein